MKKSPGIQTPDDFPASTKMIRNKILDLNSRLGKEFYCRNLMVVAKELLGKILVYRKGKQILAGKIVEVEAYDGSTDQAAHSYGRITPRNKIMFEEGGYLYVYFTYGNHHCCNVVTGEKGKGTAVLIRAIEPVSGIKKMMLNRYCRISNSEKEFYNLTSGPGKICQALGLDRSHSEISLTGNKVFLLHQPKIKPALIGISKRIGITKSVDLPWRFFIKDNPFLSRK